MARVFLELTSKMFQLMPNELARVTDSGAGPGYGLGSGFGYVFTDHDQDWSFGLVDVQGPVKFAESLVRRELKERRELTEGDRIWLYRVRKQGERFQAVYGILSGERYETLRRRYLDHAGGLALFDGVSVALGLLKRVRAGKPRAVIVQAGDAATVVMGDNQRCHWLVRMAVQDGGLAAILERIQAEAAWRKVALSGIDVARALTGKSASPLPSGIRQWPTRSYALDGRRVSSDLEALLPRLPLEFGPITSREALHRPLERAEPLAWFGLAAVGLALFLYGAWLGESAKTLRGRTAALLAETTSYQVIDPKADPAWADLSQVQDRLETVLGRPLAGEALLRLSRGMAGLGQIESIRMTEQANGLQVSVQGGIRAGLDAGPVFQRMLLGLAAQGLAVDNRELRVEPSGAVFSIDATMPNLMPGGEEG